MNKRHMLFCFIIFLSFALRFFYLGKIPNGLYSDEAAYGYNAYSILKTGRDEYGTMFPLAFRSFGDYKAPLFIYAAVPFIATFGLTEFSIRSVSATLGVLLTIVVFILGRKMFGKSKPALLASLVVATAPLGLQFHRMAHENTLAVVFVSLGVLFFLKSGKWLFLAMVCFAASMYSYHDARVVTPLVMLVLLFSRRSIVMQNKKRFILPIILFAVCLLPLMPWLFSQGFWSRPTYTSFFSDSGIGYKTNLQRGEDMLLHFPFPAVFHNKLISYTSRFLENYAWHLNPTFLFFSGDPVKLYSTPDMGIFYLALSPFLFVGFYSILRYPSRSSKYIAAWFFLTPVASSFTKLAPSASRILMLVVPYSYLVSQGIMLVFEHVSYAKKKRALIISMSFLFAFNTGFYLHQYFVHIPISYAKEWHYGMREVVEEVVKRQDKYTTVWFSKNAWGYIYPLFYLSYPPEKYHNEAKLGVLNEYGFGWVHSFGPYVFDDFPRDYQMIEKVLYVGAPSDFVKNTRPLYTVTYPDGSPAFYFADSESTQ